MTDTDRRAFLQKFLAIGAANVAGISLSSIAGGRNLNTNSQLELAAIRFGTMADVGEPGASAVGSKIVDVAGPLKTTVMLLKDGPVCICIIASDSSMPIDYVKGLVAKELDLPIANVLVFWSHNHSITPTGGDGPPDYHYANSYRRMEVPDLTPFGKKLIGELRTSVKRLPGMLQPVSVWYAEGSEGRITYNRKGRRADGSTYFMREEDRSLVGKDFNGDIDRQAPVIVFKNASGRPVAGLVQFTGHPVTSFHPEKPVVFGDWPQVATDIVGRELAGGGEPVPVGYLQGCCGDVNSKEMFTGGVDRAREFGEMLGASYTAALTQLKESARGGMHFAMEAVPVPCGPLPTVEVLRDEIQEMQAFLKRANAGNEDTLHCVGLNFPRALTPKYRGALIKAVLPWNEWALEMRTTGRADTVMKAIDVPIHVLRVGDVGIVGMQCEPFQGIGRRMRQLSPLPMTIPCGYTNGNHGYVTDSANTGDREYMSAIYRYTKFRPQFKKPAGDVLADRAVEILAQS